MDQFNPIFEWWRSYRFGYHWSNKWMDQFYGWLAKWYPWRGWSRTTREGGGKDSAYETESQDQLVSPSAPTTSRAYGTRATTKDKGRGKKRVHPWCVCIFNMNFVFWKLKSTCHIYVKFLIFWYYVLTKQYEIMNYGVYSSSLNTA